MMLNSTIRVDRYLIVKNIWPFQFPPRLLTAGAPMTWLWGRRSGWTWLVRPGATLSPRYSGGGRTASPSWPAGWPTIKVRCRTQEQDYHGWIFHEKSKLLDLDFMNALNARNNMSPKEQTDGHCDSLSSWRSQKHPFFLQTKDYLYLPMLRSN